LTRLRQLASTGALRHTVDEYERRLSYEIEMIKQMKYPGYFLIVWDFIRYAREQGIPVGPGRGSAAGSLVAYCLRITDVDPIDFDLIFERFLNPERVSLPDIAIDFCQRRRRRHRAAGDHRVRAALQRGARRNRHAVVDEGDRARRSPEDGLPRAVDADADLRRDRGDQTHDRRDARHRSHSARRCADLSD